MRCKEGITVVCDVCMDDFTNSRGLLEPADEIKKPVLPAGIYSRKSTSIHPIPTNPCPGPEASIMGSVPAASGDG